MVVWLEVSIEELAVDAGMAALTAHGRDAAAATVGLSALEAVGGQSGFTRCARATFAATYEVPALTSIASEACVVIALAAIAWRRLGFVPSLRYLWPVGLGTAAMIVTYLLIPLPALVAIVVASLVYGLVLAMLPGAVRDVVDAFVPGWRHAVRRSGS